MPPACAVHSFKEFKIKCACASDRQWYVSYELSYACTIYMANPSYVSVEYQPGFDQAKKHEDCHCDDHCDATRKLASALDKLGPFASRKECRAALNAFDADRTLKGYTDDADHHKDRRYESGGECYAQADFK